MWNTWNAKIDTVIPFHLPKKKNVKNDMLTMCDNGNRNERQLREKQNITFDGICCKGANTDYRVVNEDFSFHVGRGAGCR